MFFERLGEHNDIIKENNDLFKIHVSHALFYKPLEGAWAVYNTLRHTIELPESDEADESDLRFV